MKTNAQATDAASMAITGDLAKALMRQLKQTREPVSKSKRERRKRVGGFKVGFAPFPSRWIERLRKAGVGGATYHLALVILIENFKVEQFAVKEIVLSRVVTGQFKDVRQRAVNNLVRLGLIRVRRRKGEAVRV